VVVSIYRGSIYLPADFVKENSNEHRRGVLGHELSHILRFDAAVNILQILAQAVFWFHPFVWWANKKIRGEREKCCDEMVIARLGAKAKDYSTAIVEMLIAEHESTRLVPSLAIAGPVKNIEERIKTIMKPGKKFYTRPSLMALTVVLLLALLFVPTVLVLTTRAGIKAGEAGRVAEGAVERDVDISELSESNNKVTCTGKVVDTQGQPVAGAKVTAYELGSDGIAGNILLRQVGKVTTEEGGVFTFTTDPKPERGLFFKCKIVAVKPDLALGWAEWTMRENVESNIELGEPETLEGMVVDEKGKPVIGAEVRANLTRRVEAAEGEEKIQWLPGIAPLHELGTRTDSHGEFILSNLPGDSGVDLLVTAQGKATTYTYRSALREPAFKTGQPPVRVVLPDEARIEGRIVDPDTDQGIARTEFAVVATSSGLFYYRFVHTTNDDGTFSVGGLQTDRYLLRNGGFPRTYVEVESGKTTNISVRADRLSRPRGVAGVVRDQEGRRLSNAVVSTYPPVSMAEEIITDARGTFTLRLGRARTPNEGTTYLLVRHKERNLAIAEQLDESAQEFDITLVPGAILSGKVVDVEGRGIPGAELSMTLRRSTSVRGSVEMIRIDKSGNYEIRAVPTGHTYRLTASAEGYGKLYRRVNTYGAANERIEIEPLVLSVANLSVSGTVVDEFDRPVSGVRISASANGQPSRGTFTDVKGKFTISNVCPGQISIHAYNRRLSGTANADGGATDIKIVVAELGKLGRPGQSPSPLGKALPDLPRWPPPLLGKALPDLKNLGVDLLPGDLGDKTELVCFFDMQQRSARRCVIQLAQQAEELEQKGVTVVAIQASKVDEDELKEWIKKNNIPFPVGMIADGAEKTRSAWGFPG